MAFDSLKNLYRRIRNMFKTALIRNISEVTNNSSIMTIDMLNAVEQWLQMYAGNAPWIDPASPQTLGLPAIIASEVATSVTLEMEMNVTGSAMADYLQEQLSPVLKELRKNVEYACAGGGIVFKPYINNDKIVTEIIQANAFIPIAYDSSNRITGAYFIYRHYDKRKIYTRFEKHELIGTTYKITNECYVSTVEESLGKKCSITEVPEWEDISPEVVFSDMEKPLFAYFKMPLGNTFDTNSPLGVSIYAKAASLIKDADKQYQSLLWEYAGGELAIDASEDAFIKDTSGKPILPEGKERLFRANSLDAVSATGAELIKTFSPALRDANYINGLNQILAQIEKACHLSSGTLSNPNLVAKTATEISIMKQRFYVLISDTQASLETALEDLTYAMYSLASLYNLAPKGLYETSYEWDDSIKTDTEVEKMSDRQDVSMGLMQKYEYRMKYYGETEQEAKRVLGEFSDMTDDEILGFNNEPSANGETEVK